MRRSINHLYRWRAAVSEVGRASWWHDAPIAIKGNVWTIPRLFFGYRLLIATLLCLAFFGHWGPTFLGQHSPSLFAVTAALYLGLVGTSGLLLLRRAPAVNLQSGLMVTVDIVCITLLLYASGGVQTGLGMLIAISIATGGLMLPGRIALLFAALSTLAVLSQQTIATLSGDLPVSGYPQAGMLGFAFFAIATLALVLSQRASRSEAVISQQRLDLANLEQLNDYVIQHMQTGILVVDGDNRLRLINDAAWYLLGMPDAKSDRPIRQFCPPLAEKLEQWKNRRSSDSGSFRPTSDGRELKPGFSPLGESGNEGTVIFVEDEALVTQQAQQMKLASLGRLTASIAHEIRNPLGAIGHAGQLLQESEQLSPPDKRLLEIIATNTHRVNEIIENVLQLSRRHQSRPEEFLLRDWLLEFVQECIDYHQLPAESFSIAIDPTATLVFADRSQLRQILSNLCENSVRHFHGDPTALKLAFKGGITRASGGPFLDLTDNGPGIDPELRKQIFEPFFTTNTKGTGLGLYIARELSESNRMRLEYLPLEGGGSCFRMNFPGTRARRSET